MKIHIYFIGKPRDTHANAIAEDYMRRISHYAKAEMSEIRTRTDPWAKYPSAMVIGLDPAGKTAPSLTAMVERAEAGARDLVFIVGGADGISDHLSLHVFWPGGRRRLFLFGVAGVSEGEW